MFAPRIPVFIQSRVSTTGNPQNADSALSNKDGHGKYCNLKFYFDFHQKILTTF